VHLIRRGLPEIHIGGGNSGNLTAAIQPDVQRWRLMCGIDCVDRADRDTIRADYARALSELETIHGVLLGEDSGLLR